MQNKFSTILFDWKSKKKVLIIDKVKNEFVFLKHFSYLFPVESLVDFEWLYTITFFFIVRTFIHSFLFSSFFLVSHFYFSPPSYPSVYSSNKSTFLFFISLVLFFLLHLIFAPSPGFLREEERRTDERRSTYYE